MRKSEVKHHSDGFGRDRRPAINVKHHGSADPPAEVLDELADEFGYRDDPNGRARFLAAIKGASEDEREAAWGMAALDKWELAGEDAREVFGPSAEVYSEGRSGGWLVVHGLPDFDTWSGPMLAKWSRFDRLCRQHLADMRRAFAWHLWANVLEQPLDESDMAAAEACDVDSFAGPSSGLLEGVALK